jgi:hypothetical protein
LVESRPTEKPSWTCVAKVSWVAKVRNGVHSSIGNWSWSSLYSRTAYWPTPFGSTASCGLEA